jgi:hypothetical protein
LAARTRPVFTVWLRVAPHDFSDVAILAYANSAGFPRKGTFYSPPRGMPEMPLSCVAPNKKAAIFREFIVTWTHAWVGCQKHRDGVRL